MKYLYLILVIVYMAACNQANEDDHSHTHDDQHMDEHAGMNHDHEVSHQMVLNNGEKWKADATTNDGVNKMKASINNFKNSQPRSADQYQALGEELAQHYSELVKKCTMKGPEHDQLHVFLEQLQPKISTLKDVDNIEKGREIVNETDALVADYFNYFN